MGKRHSWQKLRIDHLRTTPGILVLLEFDETLSGRQGTRRAIFQFVSEKRDFVLQRLDAVDRVQEQPADLIGATSENIYEQDTVLMPLPACTQPHNGYPACVEH